MTARRVTHLDAAKLGPSLSVFIQVTLEKQIEEMLESFEQSSKRFPEVMECYLMTGDSDCLLRVVGRDTVELQHFIIERLTKTRRRQHPIELRPQAGQIQNCASGERSGWIAVRQSLAPFISGGVTSKRGLHGIIISGWRC